MRWQVLGSNPGDEVAGREEDGHEAVAVDHGLVEVVVDGTAIGNVVQEVLDGNAAVADAGLAAHAGGRDPDGSLDDVGGVVGRDEDGRVLGLLVHGMDGSVAGV